MCWSLVLFSAVDGSHHSRFQQIAVVAVAQDRRGFTQQVQYVIKSITERQVSKITTVELSFPLHLCAKPVRYQMLSGRHSVQERGNDAIPHTPHTGWSGSQVYGLMIGQN